jgi:uncharacterized caspase-like protein
VNDAHYAVVVGINRYPGFTDLSGARADADAFADWLLDPNGGALPNSNVTPIQVDKKEEKTFKTTAGARPTNVEIDDALLELTRAMRKQLKADPQLWEESRLYFYVAGHGFAPQGGEGALLLANADPESLSRNVELMQYRRWCTNCAWFRHVIVFADCCRTRLQSLAPGYGPALDECKKPWQGKGSTFMIGYGATIDKPTYEQPPATDDDARGYFTGALLEALRGAAPRDQSGAITADALSGIVKRLVKERTANLEFPQEATIWGEFAGGIHFGTTLAPLAPPKRKVTLQLPGGYSGQASIVKDGREIAVWDGQDLQWQVELEDGVFEARGDGVEFAGEGLFKVAGKDRRVQL